MCILETRSAIYQHVKFTFCPEVNWMKKGNKSVGSAEVSVWLSASHKATNCMQLMEWKMLEETLNLHCTMGSWPMWTLLACAYLQVFFFFFIRIYKAYIMCSTKPLWLSQQNRNCDSSETWTQRLSPQQITCLKLNQLSNQPFYVFLLLSHLNWYGFLLSNFNFKPFKSQCRL